MPQFLQVALLATLLTLTGCSSFTTSEQPPIPQINSWNDHQQQMALLTHWELSGKIGIRSPQDNQSANLFWQQQDQKYVIEMTGPLGQGGARITGQPGHIQVSIAGEGDFQAGSPEALLQDTLGWSVPVEQFQWWVRGLPAPDSSFQQQMNNNRLDELMQDGWHVRYLRYKQHDIYTLPSKIRLSRDALSITLIIKEWTPLH
ncbi:outer membrane lipoprotein LolB [Pontibacterium sp. N1Y112]|uniref:Outer-membrane lipoprotein LolB n=1 Tax=Pontibacterium sinense TaxID=2781979 RepID=A0A8J7FDN5_9GAMM|nr:lipoprotein insertase outer membrane protein LolB [Pontibacterium sinense]MBE9398122.1 outer membrane lipoprotein LolB [Pontibacterium sinense]